MERNQILENAGVPHVCDPIKIDERELKDRMAKQGADVETTAVFLAQAEEVQKRLAQALVIGADQILEYEGRWFKNRKTRTMRRKPSGPFAAALRE
jgi:predicted house-cleaning NTP pyrophosphatase (Maf/HAM1 superfamily)